jgi:hypothetical protein
MERVGIRKLTSRPISRSGNKPYRLQGKDAYLARRLKGGQAEQGAQVTDKKSLPDGMRQLKCGRLVGRRDLLRGQV